MTNRGAAVIICNGRGPAVILQERAPHSAVKSRTGRRKRRMGGSGNDPNESNQNKSREGKRKI